MAPSITLSSFTGPQLLLLSLPLLVLSEHRSRSYGGTVLFKMLSSASFLTGTLFTTSTELSPYRLAITIGLLCSLVGDFLLLPSRSEFKRTNAAIRNGVSTSFQAGVVAFAAAHIAYITAFLKTAWTISYPTMIATFITTLLLAKWLGVIYPPRSHSSMRSNILNLTIAPEMKPLVLIYAVIISSMFAVATAASDSITAASTSSLISQRVIGAAMFVVSDVFVAASAFGSTKPGGSGERGLLRIALGYGLYFWGQMVIAGTVEGQ
ncbi:YhhN-like protein [Aspergillus granulosus]|uniref:YhhN-like protein n=1 Tax=Aspergillus granulosus TaxID=176169 RepID=A0ABR4H2K9_9EURO